MTMKQYDYIVIGGGSGGIASANRAAMYGAKVILFEAKTIGGTCVNVGCVPKKVMWYGSQVSDTIYHYANEYGFQVDKIDFDFKTLKANRNAYVERIHQSYERTFDSNGVERIYAPATFVDAHIVEVAGDYYTAPHILIATGGYADYPDIPGAQYGITSDGFFELDDIPKRTAVVGAGYIAVELAGILHTLGSETHLLVRQNRPLRTFDGEMVDTLVDIMTKDGPTLHPFSIPQKVEKNSDGSLTLFLDNGEKYLVDTVIWAIGRKANTTGFGLERTGVKLDKNGFIQTDLYENTSVSGLYALGDVNGKLALTPVAVKAGRQLSERLFNSKTTAKMDYDNVPTVVFSHPPIGSIGYSEEKAIATFGKNKVGIYRSSFTSMYTALGNHRQLSKMKLVTLGTTEKIIGLHGIGYGVDEMIQGFSVAIKMGATKKDFDNTVAIHPTGAEEFVTMR